MQEFWRKTVELFREHPILWLPFIIADLTAFFLSWLQKSATSNFVHWFLIRHYHSVLGGSLISPDLDPATMRKAAILCTPLVWGSYFVHICLYTAAFVITAAVISKVQAQHEPCLAEVISLLGLSLRRIFWFALKVLALWILGGILLILVPAGFIHFFFEGNFLGPAIFGSVGALLGSICVAWLLTPAGIRLIQAPLSESVSVDNIKRGRIFAILAVAASIIISYFVMKAEASISTSSDFDPTFHHLVISPLLSLFAALPYMPLWIVLSLLAVEGIQDTEALLSG
jgi:hypothetical protein